MDDSSFKGFYKRLEQTKPFPYVRAVLRGLVQYGYFAIVYSLIGTALNADFQAVLYEYLPIPHVLLILFQILFSFLILNTAVVNFSLFDAVTRNRFFASSTREEDAENEEKLREALMASRTFWIELGVMVAFCLIAPVRHGYNNIIALLPWAQKLPGIVHHVVIGTVFALALFVMMLSSRARAQRYWLEMPRHFGKLRGRVSVEETNRKHYRPIKLVWRLLGTGALYYLGVALLSALLPVAWSAVRVVWMLLRERFILILLGLLVAFLLWRVFWKRVRFYISLRKTCKTYGFRMIRNKFFFLSMLFTPKSYQFAVEAHGKTYCCRMIASLVRTNRMQFLEDGTYHTFLGFHVPMPLASFNRYGAAMIDRGNGDNRELFAFQKTSTYAFECYPDAKKILILNPVARRVILGPNPMNEADNGDPIGEYLVYTGNAFLRALRNDSFFEKH